MNKYHILILAVVLLVASCHEQPTVCHEFFVYNTSADTILAEVQPFGGTGWSEPVVIAPDTCLIVYEKRRALTTPDSILSAVRITNIQGDELYMQQPFDSLHWTTHRYYLLVRRQRQLEYLSRILTW